MATNVLVTGCGGPAAISFIMALKDQHLHFITGDIDSNAAGLYHAPPADRVLLKRGDDPGFVDDLFEVCKKHKVDVLLPTVDSELLPVAKARKRFEAEKIKVMLASEATLLTCLDKWILVQRCAEHVPVPKSVLFTEKALPAGFAYPVLVKPRRGSGGRGIEVVRNEEQLNRLPRGEQYLLQEYLPGEEYSVDVLATEKNEVLASVPRLRMKVDSGIAVTAKTVHDKVLEDAASNLARAIGLNGVANVQFRRDVKGLPKLLEVNARFPGSMPLTVGAGINMPLLWLNDLLGKGTPKGPHPMPFKDIAMVRTWQEHFFDPKELDDLARQAKTKVTHGH